MNKITKNMPFAVFVDRSKAYEEKAYCNGLPLKSYRKQNLLT
jgi:hypothetical protein